ncbi:MAG: nucleotidyltransferase family protein [Rhodospirillales bacterium]|nr:nucleotidyltransferase family protein [Alphaproteobacteria bacterium]MCB1840685.1 nucleotidyltransferase family protein [Alphaproteobacteria bacterium]MCB9977607.1 nucleotidyltransferase family protein [Rhodospirillales bacterium]
MSKTVIHPSRAFILAAGHGKRLRPYTEQCAKPMVEIAGRSLIWRILDKLVADYVNEVVVNLHYKADLLREHLEDYCLNQPGGQSLHMHFSHEETLLDTGGGVRKMLPVFGEEPFYVIAGDAFWTDPAEETALARLARLWDPERMDILTLLQPLSRMVLTQGAGDYDLLPDGRVRRSREKSGAYMWTNIRINTPEIYGGSPEGAFSFLELMDRAEAQGRFYAIEHEGDWHHISRPEDLENVRREFETPTAKKKPA